LIVCLNENTYIDVVKGILVDKPAKSVPLSSGVSFRKLKPSVKFKKRIDNVWLSSSKYSFEFLIGCYMLKTNKKRVVGFYKIEESRYIVMEFLISVSPPGITSIWSIIKEEPQDYLEIEDKVFDAIFGSTPVSNTTIDFEKLQKEVLGQFKPVHVAAVLLLLILLLVTVYKVIHKEPLPKPVETKQPEQIALSEEEANTLHLLVFYELIDSYNRLVSETGEDRIFGSVDMHIEKGQQSVTGKMNINYKSYYPFKGSSKSSDYYTWTDNISIEKTKNDIKSISYRDANECLADIVKDDWEVTGRDDRGWHIRYISNDYKRFIKAVNKVVTCPLQLNLLTMKETEHICDLLLAM
jgi:hypothetical protein